MKRLEEFKSLSDFGFTLAGRPNNVVITPFDRDLVDNTINFETYIGEGESPSEYRTMDELVSFGEKSIDYSVDLNLNYGDYKTIATFGSVYTEINYLIQDIIDRYPNGFMFSGISIAGNEVSFNNTATTYSSHWDFYSGSYSEYKLKLFDASYTVLHDVDIVRGSGTTSVTKLYLENDPSGIGVVYGAIYPNTKLLNDFADNSTKYQLNLLYPDPNTLNVFPTFSAQNLSENIDYYTVAFDEFVENELLTGTSLDSFDTNVIWNKYVPFGIKQFDSNQNTLYKLILLYAKMYDMIRNYQNHMVYAHTISYKDYNHIPEELYDELARHWNWKLNFNEFRLLTNNEELFDSYHPEIKKKLNIDSINNEFKVRVLKNLVHFYKKKGTRSAFKVFQNLYSIPEQLMKMNEYVNKFDLDIGEMSLTSLPTNIIIPKSKYEYDYVKSDGTIATVYGVIENTTYIDLEYSEANAVEYDYFDWVDSTTHLVVDINGNTILFGSLLDDYTEDAFERVLINTFVPSDGTAMYLQSYEKLEQEYLNYLEDSPSGYMIGDFEQYLDFIEGNIENIIDQMIPAYSRILGYGRTVRNLKFYREKYKWIEPTPLQLPLQEHIEFDIRITPSKLENTNALVSTTEMAGSIFDKITPNVSTVNSEASYTTLKRSESNLLAISSSSEFKTSSLVNLVNSYCENMDVPEGVLILNEEYSGIARQLDSPYVEFVNESYSAQTGTSTFYSYTDSTCIHSDSRVRILFDTSLNNLSESGLTEFDLNIYKLEYDGIEYNIDYTTPVQEIHLSAGSSYTGTFGTWINVPVDSPENNDYSMSGSIYIGGENIYGQPIFEDKGEYFYTYDLRTEVPTGWTEFYSGSGNFTYNQEFDRVLFVNSSPSYRYGNMELKGYYFIYMVTPHVPELSIYPVNQTELDSLSTAIVFNSDETADRLYIEYFSIPGSTGAEFDDFEDPTNSLSGWSAYTFENVVNMWDTYAVKKKEITLNSSNTYSVVLSFGMPGTWYWWRVMNSRTARSSFGYNVDLYSNTDPLLVKSGQGSGPIPRPGPKIDRNIVIE